MQEVKEVFWSEIDLDFIDTIKRSLRRQVGATYEEKFEASDFLVRFKEEPHYIYHFDEEYWVDYILNDDTES